MIYERDKYEEKKKERKKIFFKKKRKNSYDFFDGIDLIFSFT
jgi:hypothetical protein